MIKMTTPWGQADNVSYLNPERTLVRVHTASHGGIGVRFDVTMPSHLDPGVSGDMWRWFEEDQEWCIPALAFPMYFKPEMVQIATDLLRNWYPDAYEIHFGQMVTAEHSAARRRDELNQRLRAKYRVRASWGDWAWDVPAGKVLALGVRDSDGDEATFLVPHSEYVNLDELVLDKYPRFTPDRTLPYTKPREKSTAN